MTEEVKQASQTDWDAAIATLPYTDLNDLRTRIAERMKHMRETGVEQMRLKIIEDAAALGLSPEDIFTAQKKQRRKRKPKQDDPADL